jgi:toxin secretion/phage lysis holin
MENTNAKGVIAIITAVLSYLLNCFTELIVVLVFLMIFDYITGIMAAYVRKEISSYKGIIGIFKKFSFILLVVLGFFFDYVISYLMKQTGLNFTTFGLVGIATCCWLIGTEAISIIENLSEIGVPIPGFLKKAFEKLKESSEEAAGGPGKEDG